MPPTRSAPQAAGVSQNLLPAARVLPWLFPAGCLGFALLLGLPDAADVPDAVWYRLLALGQRSTVPSPFSGRLLGPAIAGWFGRFTGLGVDAGFLAMGIACLIALVALVAALLWSWRAPAVIFAGIFLMPFWIDIVHDYYLPDLLHAAILAAMLLCLLYGYTGFALLLLFPAYLARESTILVAACLLFAGWRRIPLRSALIGLAAMVCGGLVTRHFGQAGPGNVHGLGGVVYIVGKLIWSFFKNLLGLPLWSNTLPECRPVWVYALPAGYHPGAIQSIGFCRPSVWGPVRLLLAWFGIFGIGPALAFSLWRGMRQLLLPAQGRDLAAANLPGLVIVFRFCIVYGVISILMAPLLGASTDRLVAYGWPFYFVVLPWFVFRSYPFHPSRSVGLLLLHLVTCWLGWFGFWQGTLPSLLTGLALLGLNGVGYVLLGRSSSVNQADPGR